MYTKAPHGTKKETQYIEICCVQQGPGQQTEIKVVFPKEACEFPQNWDVYFPGFPLKFLVSISSWMLKADTKVLPTPVTPANHPPTYPAPHFHSPAKQATGTPELLPGDQNCSTGPSHTVLRLLQTAGSGLLLRPTALWGWGHPFILPSLSIPCLMQFDAAIKTAATYPPSLVRRAAVGRVQSLCSAATAGQVLRALCFPLPLL